MKPTLSHLIPRVIGTTALATLLALSPAGAHAQTEAPRSWLATAAATMGDVIDGAGAALRGAGSFVLPEAPFDFVPERLQESDLAFIAMMQSIGLTLSEIEAGGTLLPDVRYRFLASREPSEGDFARAQRAVALHQARYSGLRAIAQRRIMQTVLEAAEGGRFQVSVLEIGVRPWPSVRYVLSARERPLAENDRRMLEALRDSIRR